MVFWIFLFQSNTVADIASDVRSSETSPSSTEGGFFELGVGFFAFDNPVRGGDNGIEIKLYLGGRYQWNGLFIEATEVSSSNLNLGYNAWNSEHWSFDLIGSQLNENIIDEDNHELKKFRGNNDELSTQGLDFLLGFRATGYYENNIIQLFLGQDISNTHDGMIGQIEAGRSWQIRNWNIHTLLGYRYHSEEVINYYLGVKPEQATATIPEYNADAGSIVTLEFGVTYPLAKHWVFRGTLQNEIFSDALNESPLLDNTSWSNFSTSLTYIF